MTSSHERIPRPTAGNEQTDIEVVLGLLSNERRRLALLVLEARDQPTSTDDLARLVAMQERNSTAPVDPASVERLVLRLHHWHLPKLAAAGAIDYDPHRKVAVLTTDAGLLSQLLDDVAFSPP